MAIFGVPVVPEVGCRGTEGTEAKRPLGGGIPTVDDGANVSRSEGPSSKGDVVVDKGCQVGLGPCLAEREPGPVRSGQPFQLGRRSLKVQQDGRGADGQNGRQSGGETGAVSDAKENPVARR